MRMETHSRVVCWLIRDTFRQAIASNVFWLMLIVSGLCIAVCFSVEVEGTTALFTEGEQAYFLPKNDPQVKNEQNVQRHGVGVITGELRVAFGALTVPVGRDAHDAIRYVQLILAGFIADTVGVLLTLLWTAAFLPAFLEPRNVSVLLAKPVPRGLLVFGKFLGVLAFVLCQSTIFVGGTWLALGLRTGVWDVSYLLCIPLLLLHFAIFFSFSVLLAVVAHSTMVCVLGSMAFWLICWGMNFGRHVLATNTGLGADTTFAPALRWIVDIGYWILPKPADLAMILYRTLDGGEFFDSALIQMANDHHVWMPFLSVVSSLVCMVVLLVAGFRHFARADY